MNYRIVYELYFGEMYNTELYLPLRFLMLVQAIEGYHRLEKNTTKQTNEQKKLYDRLIPYIDNLAHNSENITLEDVEQLKVWLRSGISPNLRTRIEETYEDFADIIPHLSIKIGSKKCYADRVRNLKKVWRVKSC